MNIDILIRNSFSKIQTILDPDTNQELHQAFSYGTPGGHYAVLRKLKELQKIHNCTAEEAQQYLRWDGKRHMYNILRQEFPTGLLVKVVEQLQKLGHTVSFSDARVQPADSDVIPISMNLWPHQEEIVTRALEHHRGIIEAATGSGKSVCIGSVFATINRPCVLLTQKLDLLYQLRESMQKLLGIPIGILGDGLWEYQPFTVAMVPSLMTALEGKRINYKSETKWTMDSMDEDEKSVDLVLAKKDEIFNKLILGPEMVLCDETHHMASNWGYKIVQAMVNAYYRFGFSATAYGYRPDGDDFMLNSCLGEVICKVSASRLVKDNILLPVDIKCLPFDHKRTKYGKKEGWAKFVDKAIVNNEERNKLIVQAAINLVDGGYHPLISVSRVGHGEVLETMLKTIYGPKAVAFVHGKDNAKTRQTFRNALASKDLKVMVSTLMGEGTDIVQLDAVINAKAGDSRIAVIQLIGRVMRKDPKNPNKKRSVFIDIVDRNDGWLAPQGNARLEVYNSQPDAYFPKITTVDNLKALVRSAYAK